LSFVTAEPSLGIFLSKAPLALAAGRFQKNSLESCHKKFVININQNSSN